ncbi:MAG: cobalt-precorrin-4 C(11)-methyltransferase, partial [[Ruminococcus] torques]
VVGRVLDGKYERSKLYDPTFTTEFRKASSHVGKAEKENTKE